MTTILDEIEEYLPNAKRYSRYVAGSCVFHDDQTPSLLVYSDRYFCKGCNESGTTNKLLQLLKFGNYRTPKPQNNMVNLWGFSYDPQEFADYAHSLINSHPQYKKYLYSRKLTENSIQKLRIGYTTGHYIFPILGKHREVLGNVARADKVVQKYTNKRYRVPFEQDLLLYIPDHRLIENSTYIVCVFGIIDAVTLCQLGIPVMTYSIGKDIPAERFDKYRKPIYVIPDMGEEKSALKLAHSLGWRGKVILLDYPEGTKDCNEILENYGEKILKEMIEQSIDKIHNHVFVVGG